MYKKEAKTIIHFVTSNTASALLGAHNMDTACKRTKSVNAMKPIVTGILFFRYRLPNIKATSKAAAEKVNRTVLDMSANCGEKDSVAKHTITPKTKR